MHSSPAAYSLWCARCWRWRRVDAGEDALELDLPVSPDVRRHAVGGETFPHHASIREEQGGIAVRDERWWLLLLIATSAVHEQLFHDDCDDCDEGDESVMDSMNMMHEWAMRWCTIVMKSWWIQWMWWTKERCDDTWLWWKRDGFNECDERVSDEIVMDSMNVMNEWAMRWCMIVTKAWWIQWLMQW
jgi:hypothetical protein